MKKRSSRRGLFYLVYQRRNNGAVFVKKKENKNVFITESIPKRFFFSATLHCAHEENMSPSIPLIGKICVSPEFAAKLSTYCSFNGCFCVYNPLGNDNRTNVHRKLMEA